jgi:hypothetical protein
MAMNSPAQPMRIVDRPHRAGALGRVPAALRWLLVLPATIVVWIATVIAVGLGGMLVHALLPEDAMERIVAIEYRQGMVGALAAFAWVVSGSVMAPSRQRWVSLVLFGLGTWLAHGLLWHWYNPADDSSDPTNVPFYLTIIGGVAGVAAMWLGGHRTRFPGSIQHPAETEAR